MDKAGHITSGLSINLNGCNSSNLKCAQAYVRSHGIRGFDTFQPANRFWLFQGIETAIFVGLAIILFGVTIWWVNRRVA
jgi:uncharacterized membrane protein